MKASLHVHHKFTNKQKTKLFLFKLCRFLHPVWEIAFAQKYNFQNHPTFLRLQFTAGDLKTRVLFWTKINKKKPFHLHLLASTLPPHLLPFPLNSSLLLITSFSEWNLYNKYKSNNRKKCHNWKFSTTTKKILKFNTKLIWIALHSVVTQAFNVKNITRKNKKYKKQQKKIIERKRRTGTKQTTISFWDVVKRHVFSVQLPNLLLFFFFASFLFSSFCCKLQVKLFCFFYKSFTTFESCTLWKAQHNTTQVKNTTTSQYFEQVKLSSSKIPQTKWKNCSLLLPCRHSQSHQTAAPFSETNSSNQRSTSWAYFEKLSIFFILFSLSLLFYSLVSQIDFVSTNFPFIIAADIVVVLSV